MTHGTLLRGADILARTLEQIGVDRVFSVSGNHIMPVYDALTETSIELIHCRHEAACVHMADAYARITGQVGIALVTGGPGHTNAAAALYTALAAEAPMLLLSGHASTKELGRGAFQELRQAEMVRPITKAAWTLDASSAIGHEVARAAQIARSGRSGPVHLSLPVDLLEERHEDRAELWPSPAVAERVPVPLVKSALDAIGASLARAERPIFVCGPTLTVAGRNRMAELEKVTATPVIGMESPRGINDPALGALPDVFARSDLIILIGKPLDFTLRFGDAPFVPDTCSFIVIDPDDTELKRIADEKGDRVLVASAADSSSAIEALIDTLATSAARGSDWLAEAREALAFRSPATRATSPAGMEHVHPIELCAALQSFLDAYPEATLVCDGGEIGQWPQAKVRARHRLINGVAGSIGSALPYALAVKCARPEHPVVAVMGDGTFGFHMAEIDTAVRHRLPVIVVIGNDARWNAEYQIQLREYGAARAQYCELLPSRYDKVAEALGAHGEHVTRAADLDKALQRAAVANRPACINVKIASVAAPNAKRP